MSNTTIKARTARKPHPCDSCWSTPSLRNTATIAAGHRYLLHTAFPGDDDVTTSDVPFSVKECIACAEAYGATERSRGIAFACVTYCCGDVPCARPFGHQDGHSCRWCAETPELPGRDTRA